MNYSAPLKVIVRLINKETGEVKQQEVFMGDFPLMTDQGTFIINGAERVIVSQLVRSPGVYYSKTIDKVGKDLFSTQVIPNRGAWLEYETDSNEVLWVKIDRQRKVHITALLRALGYGSSFAKCFGSRFDQPRRACSGQGRTEGQKAGSDHKRQRARHG